MYKSVKNGILLLFAGSVLLPGCGGPKIQFSDAERRQNEFGEIYEIYSGFVKRYQKPPRQLSDVARKEVEVSFPSAINRLRSGEFTLVWGTNVGPSEKSVLAYEKDAPQNGGMVLLADGTVKNMSASDVQAAVKPKGG